ncbi:MAG: MCE family protein, partial [Solirubrobacterales bacterium]|nr:MCE family protein [Solirubrobacterales bacterium]
MIKRMPNWLLGLIVFTVIALGAVFAFTKKLPFGNPYEVQAVFTTAQNIRINSPVRIAGVDVGTVTAVEHYDGALNEELQAQVGDAGVPSSDATVPGAAVVTMEITDEGRPIKEDAQFALEPRLFLEGNLLVNVQPGTPNAPEVDDDHVFPVNQTSVSVQLDELLTTLQSDVRGNLQGTLDSLGNAFIKYDGAKALQVFYRSSPAAFKNTSYVNEAFLGTEPHDLSDLVKNLDKVLVGLDRDEAALQGTISNFATVTGSFAAEDEALANAIATLPDVLDAADPAYANLNAAFPPLRAFAREMLPGVRSTPETLRAATPFIGQVRQLVSQDELRGLVADLRPAVPELAQLTRDSIPLFDQTRLFSSCSNEVLIPFSYSSVDVPNASPSADDVPIGTDGEPLNVLEETTRGLSGISGESRSGDANGQYIRPLAGSGPNIVQVVPDEPLGDGGKAIGFTQSPIEGATPDVRDSAKTPFRDDVRCQTQEPPDLSASFGGAPDQFTADLPDSPLPLGALKSLEEFSVLGET